MEHRKRVRINVPPQSESCFSLTQWKPTMTRIWTQVLTTASQALYHSYPAIPVSARLCWICHRGAKYSLFCWRTDYEVEGLLSGTPVGASCSCTEYHFLCDTLQIILESQIEWLRYNYPKYSLEIPGFQWRISKDLGCNQLSRLFILEII